MGRKSKRFREIADLYEIEKPYSVQEAIDILKRCPPVKFDQSVEVSLMTGVDPRKSDQHIRGTVSLPNGTGKTMVIVVITSGDKLQEATDAGADYVGNVELIEKIKSGWTNFDALVVTPDMMREVGKLGKILGPRGLMPTPKAGTVTTDITKAVSELKGGKIEFKIDKHAGIHVGVGKLSFSAEQLLENVTTYLEAIMRAKPASAKGLYIKSVVLSSTMGPGVNIDLRELESA
ncbi:MAG: 50S ribosomal protein L1 [Chlamydiae bacterium]|nr:50S ribosomal protein L1 [Chlamydiota bacterium]